MTSHHHAAPDTVVVGAGLAGLACALDLCRAGRRVALLEASDGVGGRMRTDRRDGFLLDRGFQVFNTSYPQVKRRIDLRSLRLRPFTPGLLVHTPAGPVRLADPTRRPGAADSLLPGRVLSARDLAALAALTARDALLPAGLLKRAPDRTTAAALARAGVSSDAVDRLLRPFLAGVFLEDRLETSARFFHLVWRSMVRGTLCLPAAGVGAVPAQLAGRLPVGVLRLETPVDALTADGVLLADGAELPARTVVVATDAVTAARLLPGLAVPGGRTVTTYYHAAERPPLHEPTLVVDGSGAVLNTCVLDQAAPTYAPPGTALVSTSVLGPDRPGAAEAVTRRLAELYGTDTSGWRQVAAYTVEGALPAMVPPWPLSRTTRVAAGRYVCGDHRATGSVQGALASGTRAAREVLAAPAPR
ncbi:MULTISPECIES: NAD(P)/FAD-dependent oxidoreductase [Streptomyces]|uniref:Amine oxidase n=1 Tax=Streptomyces fradiae ATCC 10745 = DSM 40063 TaxID=1319510 RepID=A0A1Y2NR65_STRFR|nr:MULTISPECIES: NAD(P)/FAD-dependent oxidoreductase [Streptomyces]KAF0648221.1 amine oxidase [Streptomyces fradiae ATCC 10745 = DSM 40063]OSY49984.1 Protoporphyrinogen oxidase [Streptomyces fradiae ATCC 10745 = DSM 40063]QEV15031.1 FAD-dependent oxidoreductase [Streptomyces fradiae ATCC 10745 = DSM 40063]